MTPLFNDLAALDRSVSRETFSELVRFQAMFQKWAERINLSAPSTLTDTWSRHILDSAQLISILPNAKNWIDLGSGGGFPGVIVAFFLKSKPDCRIELVESNRKKAAFLQAVVGEFDLPARVNAVRIEAMYDRQLQADVVTARALAPLPKLLGLAAPWLQSGAKGLFHKGRDYVSEVEESTHLWAYDLIEHPSKIDPHGVVLEIANLRGRVAQGKQTSLQANEH